ncbi:MAG: hypothetical protein R2912_09045 [Eubacteriales bacterium]
MRDITLNLTVNQSQLGKPIIAVPFRDVDAKRRTHGSEAQYTIALAENPDHHGCAPRTRPMGENPAIKVTITYTLKNTTKFGIRRISR